MKDLWFAEFERRLAELGRVVNNVVRASQGFHLNCSTAEDIARAVLEAANRPDWVMVPRKPTAEMLRAATQAIEGRLSSSFVPEWCWLSMIDALSANRPLKKSDGELMRSAYTATPKNAGDGTFFADLAANFKAKLAERDRG